jgi:NAD-dependent dihydropyrimidine dehydrogenase PreA subunit
VITEPCLDVKGQGRRRPMPGRLACDGEPMPCIHPGECAGCGACEPACPAEAIFSEDDVRGQRAQVSTENARFSGHPGRPAAPPRPARCPMTPATSPATSPAGDGAAARPTAAHHAAPRSR